MLISCNLFLYVIITCCAKLLESDWLGAMQLIHNCIGEMRAKLVIVILLVIFAVQKHVIVCDWTITDDTDSNASDFRTPNSVF